MLHDFGVSALHRIVAALLLHGFRPNFGQIVEVSLDLLAARVQTFRVLTDLFLQHLADFLFNRLVHSLRA